MPNLFRPAVLGIVAGVVLGAFWMGQSAEAAPAGETDRPANAKEKITPQIDHAKLDAYVRRAFDILQKDSSDRVGELVPSAVEWGKVKVARASRARPLSPDFQKRIESVAAARLTRWQSRIAASLKAIRDRGTGRGIDWKSARLIRVEGMRRVPLEKVRMSKKGKIEEITMVFESRGKTWAVEIDDIIVIAGRFATLGGFCCLEDVK